MSNVDAVMLYLFSVVFIYFVLIIFLISTIKKK